MGSNSMLMATAAAAFSTAGDSAVGSKIVEISQTLGSIFRCVMPQQQPPHKERKVCFDCNVTVHEIMPYSEVYSMHPREFDFDREGNYLIRDRHGHHEKKDESEEDTNDRVAIPRRNI